ncbi:MAG TPA: BREX system P-loop protein BrxC, partial [Planctomycetota bacterium]|nr:BREX system P-loop protein BrxC [Planctomycetota bacterium]
ALAKLVAAHKVRLGDGGYRIPTPAEDDWERTRMSLVPKPGDSNRILAEVLQAFWQPQPSHTLFDTKAFKAGLSVQGRPVTDGDMLFELRIADDEKAFAALSTELRARSQQERKTVFWAVALTGAIDNEVVELHRSKEMLARKEREARTSDETALVAEERLRLGRHQLELKRLLKTACVSGAVHFQGKDRSPSDPTADVSRAASSILGAVLPDIFDRFKEAAARSGDLKKGTDALFTAENLTGLPSVFGALALLRDEKKKTVFNADTGPLREVFARIESRAGYGETVSGRWLAEELAKEPFGWDFEAVRLFALSLLRAGKIKVISKGQTIDAATSVQAKETFSNNNLFKSASFQPRVGPGPEALLAAADAFKETFGEEVKELNVSPIAADLRREIAAREDEIADALRLLAEHRLPGSPVLEAGLGPMKAILRGDDEGGIATFNGAHRSIKEAILRAAALAKALTEPALRDVARARRALAQAWPFLAAEADVPDALRAKAVELEDIFKRETFYKDLAAIDQHAAAIEKDYARRYQAALDARRAAYAAALEALAKVPGFSDLAAPDRQRISAPLRVCAEAGPAELPIPQLRADLEACDARLKKAAAEVARVLEGERVVSVNLGTYFQGGIETEEQLDSALTGIRDECAKLIGKGKKVFLG